MSSAPETDAVANSTFGHTMLSAPVANSNSHTRVDASRDRDDVNQTRTGSGDRDREQMRPSFTTLDPNERSIKLMPDVQVLEKVSESLISDICEMKHDREVTNKYNGSSDSHSTERNPSTRTRTLQSQESTRRNKGDKVVPPTPPGSPCSELTQGNQQTHELEKPKWMPQTIADDAIEQCSGMKVSDLLRFHEEKIESAAGVASRQRSKSDENPNTAHAQKQSLGHRFRRAYTTGGMPGNVQPPGRGGMPGNAQRATYKSLALLRQESVASQFSEESNIDTVKDLHTEQVTGQAQIACSESGRNMQQNASNSGTSKAMEFEQSSRVHARPGSSRPTAPKRSLPPLPPP